jgi:hypothetical protein
MGDWAMGDWAKLTSNLLTPLWQGLRARGTSSRPQMGRAIRPWAIGRIGRRDRGRSAAYAPQAILGCQFEKNVWLLLLSDVLRRFLRRLFVDGVVRWHVPGQWTFIEKVIFRK